MRFEPEPGIGRVEPGEVSSDSVGVAVAEWTLGRGAGAIRPDDRIKPSAPAKRTRALRAG